MRVGITYDLRQDYLDMGIGEEASGEFDRPDTIDAIERTLVSLGHSPDRIGNVRRLVTRLARGERWDMVFNIAEGLTGFGRESQVPTLLEAYDIPYTFSGPLEAALTLHKGICNRLMRSFGVPVPDFSVVTSTEDARCVELPFPLFAKPVAEGTGKGIDADSIVRDREQLVAICRRLLDRFCQPVLVESFLPGRELTVGIVGTGAAARAIGALEIVLLDEAERGVYSYVNKERCEELVHYRLANDDEPLVREAIEVSLRAWRALGCRDAGRVDLREDAQGAIRFLEVNPLAGLNPEHSDLPILCRLMGVPYERLIGWIMESASARARSA
ncbi:MAG: hypothetical protein JW751_00660 [Polyangiaceae bacterium]|nr:hypothetical protein [Polyangiaceae bacterium]